MKHTLIKIVTGCLLVSGLLSCNKSTTSNISSDLASANSDNEYIAFIEKLFATKHPNDELLSFVSSENYPIQFSSAFKDPAESAHIYRAPTDIRVNDRQLYRDSGKGYLNVKKLKGLQDEIKDAYSRLEKAQYGKDSVVVVATIKSTEPGELDATLMKLIYIFKRGQLTRPVNCIGVTPKVMARFGAVDLALQDSLILGDMDFERLHREATNPVMKEIYAPLPQ